MLDNGRLEKETGTANKDQGATTEPGPIKEGDDCDPNKAAMNINPEDIRKSMGGAAGGSKILAALLAHEWLHTTQTKIDEKAGYTKQMDMLNTFIAEEGGEDGAPARLKDVHRRIQQNIEILKDKAKLQPFPYKEIYYHLKSEFQS